jgi:hypothetical protein
MRCQLKVPKTTYDEYRTTTYDPAAKITLGRTNLRLPKMRVSSWKKNIKISPMDYKPFKDEASWTFQRASITTIESHGLDHLIDINYVVANLDLDKIQRGWLTRSSKIPFQLKERHRHSHIDLKILENLGRNVRTL